MYRIVSLASASLGLLASTGLAQRPAVDLSLGLTSKTGRASIAVPWRLEVGSLVLGAGPRVTYYAGEPALFKNRGPVSASLPAERSIDPAAWSVNLMVVGEVHLGGPVSAGANIDLVGIAGGPGRSSGATVLEPARGSLFLYGSRDRGSLNSEFYASIRVGDRVRIRGGMSHYVVGYRASVGGSESRYQRFDTVPFLAVRIGR